VCAEDVADFDVLDHALHRRGRVETDFVQINFGLLWSDIEQSHVVVHDEAVNL
jgi:hypothetical protein